MKGPPSMVRQFGAVGAVAGVLLLALAAGGTGALLHARALATQTTSRGLQRTRASESALAQLYKLRIAEEAFLSEASAPALQTQVDARAHLDDQLQQLAGAFADEASVLALIGDARRRLEAHDQALASRVAILTGKTAVEDPNEFQRVSDVCTAALVAAESTLRDISNRSAALNESSLATMSARLGSTVALVVGVLCVALGALLVTFVLGARIATGVHRFAREVTEIGGNREAGRRLPGQSSQEMDNLATAFNRLLDEVDRHVGSLAAGNAELKVAIERLQDTRRQLADASRRTGMADVATAVLHNVGNVLNSVNVSAGVITQALRNSKGSGVRKLAQLLAEPEITALLAQHPKAEQVPRYVLRLGEVLAKEQKSAIQELEGLQRNIDHIKVIVSMQQAHAKGAGGVVEPVALDELLRDAILMSSGAMSKASVEVVPVLSKAPPTLVDRHKVFQIVMNLLSNAKHAVADSGRAGRVQVRLECDGAAYRIEVSDTGCGIAPENIHRIFNHGFTTKKDGHGFGLHASANAATELGGQLTCESAGVGQGALFRLVLPARAVKAAA